MKKLIATDPESISGFIELSGHLQNCLEARLDELCESRRLGLYLIKGQHNCCECNEELFVAHIIGNQNESRAFARASSKAVKTWCGMYAYHRLAILNRFQTYCSTSLPGSPSASGIDLAAVFSSFLLIELAGILNEGRWSSIRSNYLQIH